MTLSSGTFLRRTPLLRMDVPGLPAPQGSKSAVQRGGHAWVIEGGSGGARQRLEHWRHAVAAEARTWSRDSGEPPTRQPVTVELTFRMARLAQMPRRYRFHTSRPDVDKLCRAVLDALTGIVYANDSQVVELTARKAFAGLHEAPGCLIEVGTVTADEGR